MRKEIATFRNGHNEIEWPLRNIRWARHRSNRYDHLGRRVQKITPEATHTYFYDGWQLVKETRHPAASQSGGDAARRRVSMEGAGHPAASPWRKGLRQRSI